MFANQRTAPTAVFDPNPMNPGADLDHQIFLRLNGFQGGHVYAGGDVDPGQQFHGHGPELQSFKGAANPAATTVVSPGQATLDYALSAGVATDPVRRSFADRLKRKSAL